MADSTPSTTFPSINTQDQSTPAAHPKKQPHKKLSRLPNTHKIQKRPLLHPPIATPYSSSAHTPKVIYISAHTPFVATVKRIRKYLSEMENRTSKATAANKNAYQGKGRGRTEELRGLMQGGDDAGFLKGVEEGLKSRSGSEEVVLKATGKAIERLLSVACWLEGQGGGEEFVVRVRTGSVGAVDDVVVKDGEEDGDEEVGSRVRRVSCLEVGVRYKGL